MAEPCGYEGIATLIARSERAITEAKAAGIDKKKAVIVTAVSWNESGALIQRTRDKDLLYDSCWPCRQVVGWEWGRTNRVPKPWSEDPEIMKYLDDRGKEIGKPLYTGSGTTMKWTAFMSKYDGVDGNTEQARAFEWLMSHRKASALVAYSIGPTQQYLCYSPLVAEAYTKEGRTRPCGPGAIPKRFATWEHLFNFYMSTKGGGFYDDASFDYLPTSVNYFPYAGMQACGDANNPDCVEYYLSRHQAGFLDWTSPTWSAYAKKFATANNACWQIATKQYG